MRIFTKQRLSGIFIFCIAVLMMFVGCNIVTSTHPTATISTSVNNTTLITTSPYNPSGAIEKKFNESEVSFGIYIPIPTYIPQGYEISDVQVIQQTDSEGKEADITITKLNETNITLSVTYFTSGLFRILPTALNYQNINMDGDFGTYSNSMLNYFTDHNTLWWDWAPAIISSQQLDTTSFSYYELVLSADTSVPVDELVMIAKSVR
jgi:hypothetical protein